MTPRSSFYLNELNEGLCDDISQEHPMGIDEEDEEEDDDEAEDDDEEENDDLS